MILVSACMAGIPTRYDGKSKTVRKIEKLVEDGKAMLVCPEQLGGLPTPREPAEIRGGNGEDVLSGNAKVINHKGEDVTEAFIQGAKQTLKIAKKVGATKVILKEHSPSCGSSFIYSGKFDGVKKEGMGVTAALLRQNGIEVLSEEDLTTLDL